MAVTLETRQVRAWEMLSNGNEIKRINENTYRVHSQSSNRSYLVIREGTNWTCECPDFVNRQVVCKHIYCCFFSNNFRQEVTTKNLNLAIEVTSPDEKQCSNCGSTRIHKWGWKHRSDGTKIQRFKCISCSHRWNAKTVGFEHMRANPHAITVALDLYFKGVSLRKIVDHLQQFEHVNVSHVAILKWIQKYVEVMRDYVDAMKPELSRVFHADETKVNVRGQWVWLWHLMDGDTRFLLANHVSKGRNISDAREAFREAKANAKVEPRVVLTDGLGSYSGAAAKEFPDAVHVAGVGLQGRLNNNRMERYQGTLKERTKVMRALKNTDTAILDGQRIYYNHIRPHQGLNGKTPAQAAGLELDLGENKWKTLIQNASEEQTRNVKNGKT